MVLSILSFCNWWWLWWILPALLGWLLGRAMMSKWKSRVSELERDLSTCKIKYKALENQKKKWESRSVPMTRPSATRSNLAAAVSTTAASSAMSPKDSDKKDGEGRGSKRGGAWAKLKSNNMQIIEGIGPKMNEVLNENGISSWSILAGKSREELKAILDKYGDKYKIIEPGDWPKQAEYAAKDDWEGLMKYQSDDGSPSKAKKLLIKMGIIKDDA